MLAAFAPVAGTTFLVGSNDSTDAITGTFAQGLTVTSSSGQVFDISYTGGDGNDLLLTAEAPAAVPEPATWMLMGVGLLVGAQRFRRKQ